MKRERPLDSPGRRKQQRAVFPTARYRVAPNPWHKAKQTGCTAAIISRFNVLPCRNSISRQTWSRHQARLNGCRREVLANMGGHTEALRNLILPPWFQSLLLLWMRNRCFNSALKRFLNGGQRGNALRHSDASRAMDAQT